MSYPSMPPPPDPQPVVTCYRHPDRRAGVRCQRCERPICPSCMSQASVGFQCPECVRQGARSSPSYSARALPGDRPIATFTIIALNLLAFVGQVLTIRPGENLVWGMAGNVGEAGALQWDWVAEGEWWRLVTSGFLHVGVIHIAMNMYVLYAIGPQLERLLGPLRFVGLYLASLLAGSLGVMLMQSGGMGASGAIFGLLGAAAAFQLSNRVNLWQSGLGTLILINLVITFTFGAYISIGAHVGGLIGGGVVGYLLFTLEQRRVPAIAGTLVGLGCAALFFLASLAVGAASLAGQVPF